MWRMDLAITSELSGQAPITQQHNPRLWSLWGGFQWRPRGHTLESPLLSTSGREVEQRDNKVYQLH